MAGSGRKTFSPGDVLTSSDVQNYLMDQSVMVFAGTAARASAIPSPSTGMVAYSTATGLQLYNGTAWVAASTGYGVATGGTSITPWTVATVNYNGSKFTTDGTLTVSTAGLFDYALIGGGGSGSGGRSSGAVPNGGAGGAGMYVTGTVYLAATTYAVKVGAGEAGVSGRPVPSASGTTAITNVVAATAGGGGQGYGGSGFAGGQGGGGGTYGSAAGYSSLLSTGFAGGNGVLGATGSGGGGGGAGGVGGNGSGLVGGTGGAGVSVTNFNGGVSLTIAGGGGGGGTSGGTASDGGGASGNNSNGANGTANTGGGGGGGNSIDTNVRSGGNGGSGIAFIRWKV